MKNFKKAAIRLLAVCIAIALCNIPCIALGAEAVPVTAVTVVGANYTLPSTVNDKTVEWTTNAVNTSVPGSHYYTGTDSDGAAVKLTLKVMETETIFSDDMQSYATGANATRPALVNGKGLSLDDYDAAENNVYVDSVDETKAVKVLPRTKWSSKFAIGEEAYAGNFEVNMKIRAAFGTGVDTEILRTRVSAGTANNSNLVGGFLIKERADRIYAVAYDGVEANLNATGAESSVAVTKGADKDSIGLIEVKMVFDSSNKTYDLYIEDELLISGFKMNESAAATTAVQSIFFAQRISAGTDITTYIEEISVNKLVDTQAYKTLIYEDMEKFAADTDATAGSVVRPTLIRANTEAATATAGLVFDDFNESTNDIYIKDVDGNKVLYNNGQTGWNNYLALPQSATGNFDVTARVKFDVTDNKTGNFISLVAHDSVLDKSAGGVRLTYSTNLLAITYTQAGIKETNTTNQNIANYVSVNQKDGRLVSDWIEIKLSFSSDKTYDVYINGNLIFENVTAYNGKDTTGKIPVADQIKFACRGTDGTFVSMVDDIKVTVLNSGTAQKQLLIAGDSIAAGTANAQVEGWANFIGERLQNIVVNSNAKDGQCTNSFYKNSTGENGVLINRFDELMWDANPGDVLVLSFGHNDRSRVAGTAEKKETYTMADYKKYLVNCINKAKAYRVSTILATSVAEPIFVDGELSEINTSSKYTENTQVKDFAEAMREVAREENVPVIDLNAKTKTLLSTIGEDSAKNYYYSDKTHLLERGAKTVAKYLTDGFAVTVLAPYVKKGIIDGGIVVSASLANGVSIVNNDEVNYDGAKIIKAEFNGSSITDAEIIDAPLASGGIFEKAIEVADGNTAKIFLFENLDTIVPLANPVNAN